MNNEIINKAIEMYFAGEDWQGYIKEEVRRRKALEQACLGGATDE